MGECHKVRLEFVVTNIWVDTNDPPVWISVCGCSYCFNLGAGAWDIRHEIKVKRGGAGIFEFIPSR